MLFRVNYSLVNHAGNISLQILQLVTGYTRCLFDGTEFGDECMLVFGIRSLNLHYNQQILIITRLWKIKNLSAQITGDESHIHHPSCHSSTTQDNVARFTEPGLDFDYIGEFEGR